MYMHTHTHTHTHIHMHIDLEQLEALISHAMFTMRDENDSSDNFKYDVLQQSYLGGQDCEVNSGCLFDIICTVHRIVMCIYK